MLSLIVIVLIVRFIIFLKKLQNNKQNTLTDMRKLIVSIFGLIFLCTLWVSMTYYISDYGRRVEVHNNYQESIGTLRAEIAQIKDDISKIEQDESLTGPQAIAKAKELFEKKEELNDQIMKVESEIADFGWPMPSPTRIKIYKFLIFFSLE